MGVLRLVVSGAVPADGSNYSVIVFLICLGLFGYFAKSRFSLSRSEGLVLLLGYALFVLFELVTGPGWSFGAFSPAQ